MKFTVNWLPASESELAELWLNAPERDSVSRAAHIIDQLLESNPEEVGESRPEGRRIAFVSPLGVLFRLKTASVVEVLHVWRFER
jgi:hypothetical protein